MLPDTRLYIDPKRPQSVAGIHVPAMGIHETMPAGLIHHGGPGSGHPYLLMLFHNPADVLTSDSGKPTPAGGKLIVWDIEQLHHYGNGSQAWDHTWLHLHGPWADRLVKREGGVPLNVLLPINRPEVVVNYLQLLCDELQSRVKQDPAMIEGIVSLLWQYLSREVQPGAKTSTPVDPRLDAVRQLLEASFTAAFDLAKYAELACLSPSYFCHRFARQFGLPPGEYVTRLRMRRAAKLLTNRELAVFQIAAAVGYDDPLYFSRLFRKRFGASPEQYRKEEVTQRGATT